MKNKLQWTVIILVAAAIGFTVWSQRSGLPIDRVLPSNPLVFVRLNHVQEHIEHLVRSGLGKNIAAIDLPEVLARNNFSPKDVRDWKRWQSNVVKCWQNPVVRKYLGREVAVAVYPRNDSYQAYLVLRLSLSTRILEGLGQFSHRWGDNIIIRRQKYRGRGMNQIILLKEPLTLSYVRLRDLLIIAPGPMQSLEDIINVYEHKAQALQKDPSFNFVRRNAYAKADGMVFVNVSLLSELWRDQMDLRLTSLGYQTAAFPVYGLSYQPGVVSKYKMIVGLDEQYMPTTMRKTFSCPALTNDTLKLVPADAIAYHWAGCYNFKQSWEAAKQRLAQNPELTEAVAKFKDNLESHFNINIHKDILPILGHEVGGYLTDVDMQGTYPFPRFLVFVKVRNRPKAEKLLDQLTRNSSLHTEDYGGVNIHYISLPMGGNIDPGYGFLDDYLLMATSRQLIKRSIEAYSNSLRSIVSDDAVTQFSLAGGEKFHSVTLMKTAELSRRAQDFLGWMDKYLSGQVSMAAAAKQDVDNKQHELDEAIADKSAELVLAQKKLTQLKSGQMTDVPDQDHDLVNGAIANLNREEDTIRQDIAYYKEQKEDFSRALDNYTLSARSAKLTMYNMDNIVSPVLKGLESIDAQAVTVRFGNKVLETEFLVK